MLKNNLFQLHQRTDQTWDKKAQSSQYPKFCRKKPDFLELKNKIRLRGISKKRKKP